MQLLNQFYEINCLNAIIHGESYLQTMTQNKDFRGFPALLERIEFMRYHYLQ